MRLYSVKDLVADECGPVITAKNDAVATRMFIGLVTSDKSINPNDYQLLYLGVFDTSSGIVKGNELPALVSVKFTDEVEDDE